MAGPVGALLWFHSRQTLLPTRDQDPSSLVGWGLLSMLEAWLSCLGSALVNGVFVLQLRGRSRPVEH